MKLFDVLTKVDNDEIFTVKRIETDFLLKNVGKACMLGKHPDILKMDIKRIELNTRETSECCKPTFIFIV